jgi:hypothetical protein
MSTNSKSFQVSQAIANGPDTLVGTTRVTGTIAAANTATLVLAAKAGHYYSIVAYHLSPNPNTGSDLSYTIANASNGATKTIPGIHLDKGSAMFVCPFNPDGWFVTGVNEPIYITATATGGGYNFVIREVYVPTKHPDLL